MKEKLVKIAPWLLFTLIYSLIFIQYPVGVSISRLVLHKDVVSSMQPSYLLLWGFIRLGVILPLIYTLVSTQSLDGHDIYMRLGNFKRVVTVTFWSTFIFTLLGVVLYPWFLSDTNMTLLLILENVPIFLVFAIANSFVEEIFFRGIGLSLLSQKFGPLLSNIFQAVLFAAIHLFSPMATHLWLFIFLTLILGLLWGYLTQKFRSLLPAIVIHVVADIFVAISLF